MSVALRRRADKWMRASPPRNRGQADRVMLRVLFVNAAIIVGLALVAWGVAVRRKDPSFIDAGWGFGFVVVAWSTFLQTDHGNPLLVGLATLWGLRLAGYLLWRWRKNGPDARYVAMLKHKSRPSQYMLTNIFLLQAVLLLVVALPLVLGQMYDSNGGPLRIVGAALALTGIVFESVGDFQLVAFKSNAANLGAVMDRGLWRYTRHPNYFGDFCVWWGLFLVSLTNGVTAVGIISPIVMSVLLMRVSGVGPLEKQLHKSKPAYRDYTMRTSPFFPRPPRSAPDS
jgi:steroid 5-alpha reductase family enzyme